MPPVTKMRVGATQKLSIGSPENLAASGTKLKALHNAG